MDSQDSPDTRLSVVTPGALSWVRDDDARGGQHTAEGRADRRSAERRIEESDRRMSEIPRPSEGDTDDPRESRREPVRVSSPPSLRVVPPSNASDAYRLSDRDDADATIHVLVVDDDPVVQRLVRVTLADEGYEVDVASDGEEALRIASDVHPDAIVLDLEMPRLDGRAAFRELRQRGVRAPVLVLSANGAHAARRELNAEAALDKPFDPFELLRRLERLLDAWSTDRAAAAGN